jgi:hypothetical protein
VPWSGGERREKKRKGKKKKMKVKEKRGTLDMRRSKE